MNLLGKYQLKSGKKILGEVPSIQIRYPLKTAGEEILRSIVEDSGLECIIEPQPDIVANPMIAMARKSEKYYQISLDQHDPTETLTEAIEALCCDPRLFISETVDVRGALKTEEGILPPRAILYHKQASFLHF